MPAYHPKEVPIRIHDLLMRVQHLCIFGKIWCLADSILSGFKKHDGKQQSKDDVSQKLSACYTMPERKVLDGFV